METYTSADGTRWERVWVKIGDGIEQLQWVIAKPSEAAIRERFDADLPASDQAGLAPAPTGVVH